MLTTVYGVWSALVRHWSTSRDVSWDTLVKKRLSNVQDLEQRLFFSGQKTCYFIILAETPLSLNPSDCFNPLPATLSYLNFNPLEIVSRYRDPQLQLGEKYSY